MKISTKIKCRVKNICTMISKCMHWILLRIPLDVLAYQKCKSVKTIQNQTLSGTQLKMTWTMQKKLQQQDRQCVEKR